MIWSNAAESAYLEHLDFTKDVQKKMKGRGKVILTTTVPERKTHADEHNKHPRCEWGNEAWRCLRQARRCEAISYRLNVRRHADEALRSCSCTTVEGNTVPPNHPQVIGAEPSSEKERLQAKVDRGTIQIICKYISMGNKFEADFKTDVERLRQKEGLTMMDDPLLRRMAIRYHEANKANRRKAMEGHQRTKLKMYQVKGKGQWDL